MCRQAKSDESGEIFQPAAGLLQCALGSFAQVGGNDRLDADACLAHFDSYRGTFWYTERVHLVTGHGHHPRVAYFAQLRCKHTAMLPYIPRSHFAFV